MLNVLQQERTIRYLLSTILINIKLGEQIGILNGSFEKSQDRSN
jgi:hypothetical protein